MKQTIVLLICVFIFGCKSDIKQKDIDFADLNLILQTNEKIDSVWIMDIGQQRENLKLPFADTLKINLKDSINDLYLINFIKNGKIVSSPMSNQIWLKGEKIIIQGRIENQLLIDTVINSDIYYNSKRFRKNYKELFNQKADSNKIDNYILKTIEENYDSPFSLQVADNYIRRNINRKDKLKKLNELIKNQNSLIKNHGFITVHSDLKKKLKIKKINLSEYKLYNKKNQISEITTHENKVILLDFWFVECAPCIRDHKIISQRLDLLKNKNVELIGISIDKSYSKWHQYLENKNYNWRNFREIDTVQMLTKALGVSDFPTYVLLNKNGEIEKITNSFEQIEKLIILK